MYTTDKMSIRWQEWELKKEILMPCSPCKSFGRRGERVGRESKTVTITASSEVRRVHFQS
ncbi:hypothetical protein X975_26079, partial [Stegodyphus mimosarum]